MAADLSICRARAQQAILFKIRILICAGFKKLLFGLSTKRNLLSSQLNPEY